MLIVADRMASLPAAEAEALLEQELARLATRAKQLETTSGVPEIASSMGYKVSVVVRTRVAELLQRR